VISTKGGGGRRPVTWERGKKRRKNRKGARMPHGYHRKLGENRRLLVDGKDQRSSKADGEPVPFRKKRGGGSGKPDWRGPQRAGGQGPAGEAKNTSPVLFERTNAIGFCQMLRGARGKRGRLTSELKTPNSRTKSARQTPPPAGEGANTRRKGQGNGETTQVGQSAPL